MNKHVSQLTFILYARKSSESEDRQVVSIADQIHEMTSIAKTESLSIVQCIEESQSAKEPGRAGFEKLIMLIKSGKANGVLCWDLDRLARNPIDGGTISWLLQTGVLQCIKTYNSEHKTQDNALILQMHFGMATQYVRDLSKNVKRGLRNKALRGWNPGSLPLGYKHVSPKKFGVVEDEIQVDPPVFNAIRSLWDKILTGQYSIQQIHNQAIQMGILSRYGRLVGRQTIYNIFKNEFYAGYFTWENENGIMMRIHGKHKSMVTTEEYNYVQTKFFHGVNWNNPNKKTQEMIHRILSCGACGNSITMEYKKRITCSSCSRRFSARVAKVCPRCRLSIEEMDNPKIFEQQYFHCVYRSKGCKSRSVNRVVLLKALMNQLMSFDIIPHVFERFMEEIYQSNTYYFKEEKARFTALNKQIEQDRHKLATLPNYAFETGLSRKEYQDIKQKIHQRLHDNTKAKTALEMVQTGWEEEILNAASFLIDGLARIQHSEDADLTTFFKGLCSKIILLDRNVRFVLLPPFKMLDTINEKLDELIKNIEPNSNLIFSEILAHPDFILASSNSMRVELYKYRKISLGQCTNSNSRTTSTPLPAKNDMFPQH